MLESLFAEKNTPAMPSLPTQFLLDEDYAIQLTDQYDPNSTWRLLSHQVRRYPLDLRAHARRVLLACKIDLQERLAGSLLDLFLALRGKTGSALKQRLLEQAAPHLNENEQAVFAQWLEDGSSEQSLGIWFLGSVLSTGETQIRHKLLRLELAHNNDHYADPLAEVQDYLAYGQVEPARLLLEQEILAGRGNEALEQELMGIYQSTRQQTDLYHFLCGLAEKGMEVEGKWIQLKQEAESW